MVRIQEHIERMIEIKKQADNAIGNRKLQLMKCYHRMQKQLSECKIYLET